MPEILAKRDLLAEVEKKSKALGLSVRMTRRRDVAERSKQFERSGGWAAARWPIACPVD